MSEFRNRLQGAFLFESSTLTDDYSAKLEILGSDWPAVYESSDVALPVYLRGLDRELFLTMHDHSLSLNSLYDKRYERTIRERVSYENPTHIIRVLLELQNFEAIRALHGTGLSDEADELLAIIYADALSKEAGARASTNPRAAVALLESESDTEVQYRARTAIDWKMHSHMHSARSIDKKLAFINLASSDLARSALRSAFDYKVLLLALKAKKTDGVKARDIIIESASSLQAREIMLGHLALGGYDLQEEHKNVYYEPRISEFVRLTMEEARLNRVLAWQREEGRLYREELRRKGDEARARADEYLRQAQEAMAEAEAHAKKARQAEERVAQRAKQRLMVKSVLARVSDRSCRKTLEGIKKEILIDIIEKVNQMRTDADDVLSARRIYGNFHFIAEQEGASDDDKEAAKIVGLFMSGNFSKDATLPF